MNDLVNHPSHYTDGGIETMDFIEAKNLGFHLGNVVKYVSRAGKKNTDNEIQDLEKALWYLKRYISLKKKTGARSDSAAMSDTNDFIKGLQSTS